MKIGIIVGSSRPNSASRKAADWLITKTKDTSGEFELIDLIDIDLPHYNEPGSPYSGKNYKFEKTKKWSNLIESYDRFIFITPEYNGSYPGVLKDAIDYLYHEWSDKRFGIIGLGGKGGKWASDDLKKLLTRLGMIYTNYVGIKEPWFSIKSDGSIDESFLTSSIDVLIKEIQK